MRNNLAELTDINIDIEGLRESWEEQKILAGPNFPWTYRNYCELSFFTEYFQNILIDIEKLLGEKPKDYIIQLHDPRMHIPDQPKYYLNIPHQDWNRMTCINLPVYYNGIEPVNFFDTEKIEEYQAQHGGINYLGKTRDYLKIAPQQIGHYSSKHPTLMNVNNFHNVRVIDDSHTRIFVQMSYDITFDEFIAKDINTRIL